MNGKDFFGKLKEQGKISTQEYDAFLGSVPDFEMPDTVFQSFENSFLTVDRAKADHRIQSHLKAEVLDGVDSWISDGVNSSMWSKAVLDEKDTFKRLKLIKDETKRAVDALKNYKPDNGDKDKRIADLSTSVDDLTNRYNALQKESKESGEKIEKDFKKRLESLELDYAIKEHINQYTYADEHLSSPEKKRVLSRIILEEIKQGNHLSLKDGQVKLWGNETLTEPKFEGNTIVEFKTMLDKVVDPYLKKNTGATKPTPGQKPAQPVTEKSTLRQIRQGTSTAVNGTI